EDGIRDRNVTGVQTCALPIYCTVCHGIAGDGQGIIMTGGYGYVPAPSFHIDRLREAPDGHFYSSITNGIRNMPSYAQQIPVKDRSEERRVGKEGGGPRSQAQQ